MSVAYYQLVYKMETTRFSHSLLPLSIVKMTNHGHGSFTSWLRLSPNHEDVMFVSDRHASTYAGLAKVIFVYCSICIIDKFVDC